MNLQAIGGLIAEIMFQLLYLLLEIDDFILGSVELLAEEVAFLRKLLLQLGLNFKRLLERFYEELSYLFNVIYEHDITQLPLLLLVTALLRQVMLLITFYA